MVWETPKGRQKKGAAADPDFAAQILKSLFNFKVPREKEKEKEWACLSCGCGNWQSRQACRKCAAKKGQKKKADLAKAETQESADRPDALAPWATHEMKQERAAKLAAAIHAVQASGGCDSEVSKLEAKLKAQEKATEKAAADGPSRKTIESTRAYIARQEKKVETMEAEVVRLQAQQQEVSQSIAEAKERVQKMETEVAEQLAPQKNASDLEAAVRMLMVTLHAYQELPPAVVEAVSGVVKVLPLPGVSQDAADVAVDGHAVPEASVPAGSVDAALSPDVQMSPSEKRSWAGTFGEIDGIAEDADTDLLTWAKKVKKSFLKSQR